MRMRHCTVQPQAHVEDRPSRFVFTDFTIGPLLLSKFASEFWFFNGTNLYIQNQRSNYSRVKQKANYVATLNHHLCSSQALNKER
jgi:hypothetical protein